MAPSRTRPGFRRSHKMVIAGGASRAKATTSSLRDVPNRALPIAIPRASGSHTSRPLPLPALTFDFGDTDDNGIIFESFAMPSQRSRRNRHTYAQEANSGFNEWFGALPSLEEPYLTAHQLVTHVEPQHSEIRDHCGCLCRDATARSLRVISLRGVDEHVVVACTLHFVPNLVRTRLFPANIHVVHTAFSFGLLRFFRALQHHSRLGAHGFVKALFDFHNDDQGFSVADQSRKQLQRAALWFDVLEGRLRARVFARPTADDPSPPLQETLARTSASPIDSTQASSHPTQPIHDDVLAHATVDPDLSLTITDLARRCPACFGGIASGSSVPQSPNVIVCLDGNFAHKRRKRNDAVTRSPSAPTFFLSTRQVASAQKRFLSSAKSDGPRTGCSSEVKAAVEGAVKASKGAFDVVGVIGLTCRHGCPLLLCDVRETGEAHFYAYALLDHLVRACSGRIDSLGICYDIGCKLAVSPRLKASFQEHKIKLSFAVSLFHVFGHDLDCQLKYSPRRTPGYGLTDGESLERLWSAMADLVSSTRGMSLVGRHHTLSSHLSFIANEHLARIASFLKTRQIRVLVERKRIVQQIERASAAVTARATTTGVNLSHSNTAPTSFPDSLRHLASTFESLSQQRQVNAFNRPTAYRRRRAANSASESTVQVSASQLQGSLHLSAQSLYLALSQWHALDSFVKRRDSAASQKTQERLNSAKTAALTKAKRLRLAVNDVIEATNNITGPTASQLSLIAEARLLSTETLAQVSRLGAFHVHSSEPWFLDSDLMGGLDGYELLVRCDEEAARLETELTNLWTWIGTTQSGIEANRNVMACSGWSELVDRELKKLKTLKTWWGRPPPKNHAFIDALAEGGGLDPDLDDDEQDLDDPEPPSPHTTLSRSPQLSDLADSPLCDAGTGNKGGEVNEDGDFELDDDDFEKLYGALSVDKLAISPASDQDDSSTEDE